MMTERDHFLTRYVEHDTLIWEYLNSSIHLVWFHAQRSLSRNEPFSQAPYLEKKFKRIYQGDAYKYRVFDVFNFLAWKIILFRFYRLSDRLILNNALDTEMGSSDIDSAMRSFFVPVCPELFCPVESLPFVSTPGISGRSLNTCNSFATLWESFVTTLSMIFQLATWLKWSSNLTWLKLYTKLCFQGGGTGRAECCWCGKDHRHRNPFLHQVASSMLQLII